MFLKSCADFRQIIALILGFKLDHHPNSNISSNTVREASAPPLPAMPCLAPGSLELLPPALLPFSPGNDRHLTYDMVTCFWGRTLSKDKDIDLCCSPPYRWVPRTRKAAGISSDYLQKSKRCSSPRTVRNKERAADDGLRGFASRGNARVRRRRMTWLLVLALLLTS